ncbi:MAG: peptidoglycan editing factor PgeF [Candidatus Woykebacteria bacterium]
MLLKKDDVYTLSSLANFKNLVVEISTKKFGDQRLRDNQTKFFKYLDIDGSKVIKPRQIHSGAVRTVSLEDVARKVEKCDGFVTAEKDLYLMILVADCLPIVAFDPKKRIVGLAHAGWRGTKAKIAENLVGTLLKLGSRPKDILVGFGPVIEFCHYEVRSDVASAFTKSGFGKSVMRSLSGSIHLDLKQANVDQLIDFGIIKPNIDVTIKSCTYENPDFFSYRRDGTDSRIAVLIGLRNGG